MHSVYMIKNLSNQLYIGVTEDPETRLRYHNEKRGAQFTKQTPTYKIVFLEQYQSLKEARTREVQIKKWRRAKKDLLINRYFHGLETR